jgi:hypothetical protein
MQDLEQTIRERAYYLWTEGGYQEGNAEAYWLAAQREFLASSLQAVGAVGGFPKASKKASRKAKDAPATGRRKARAA